MEPSRDRATLTQPSHSKLVITEVNSNDVLFGRGAPYFKHVGNIHFQKIVNHRKAEYTSSADKDAKNAIADSIVSTIKASNGRFLRDIKTNEEREELGIPDGARAWTIANDYEISNKVKQALREKSDKTTKTQLNSLNPPSNRDDAPEQVQSYCFANNSQHELSTSDQSQQQCLRAQSALLPENTTSQNSEMASLPASDIQSINGINPISFGEQHLSLLLAQVAQLVQSQVNLDEQCILLSQLLQSSYGSLDGNQQRLSAQYLQIINALGNGSNLSFPGLNSNALSIAGPQSLLPVRPLPVNLVAHNLLSPNPLASLLQAQEQQNQLLQPDFASLWSLVIGKNQTQFQPNLSNVLNVVQPPWQQTTNPNDHSNFAALANILMGMNNLASFANVTVPESTENERGRMNRTRSPPLSPVQSSQSIDSDNRKRKLSDKSKGTNLKTER